MLAALISIDQLSKDVYQLSQQGAWQAALDLQKQRKSRILEVFAHGVLVDTSEISLGQQNFQKWLFYNFEIKENSKIIILITDDAVIVWVNLLHCFVILFHEIMVFFVRYVLHFIIII